jgi:hypothetical protein
MWEVIGRILYLERRPNNRQFLGSYWTGHMSNEEDNSLYKCTVREFMRCTSGIQVVHPLKQWSCRRWAWMDRASEKPEDLLSITFSLWSTRCLSYNTGAQPIPHHQQDTTTTGFSVVLPSSVGVDTDMSGVHPRWKHLGSHWFQLPTPWYPRGLEGCCNCRKLILTQTPSLTWYQ